MCSDVILNFWIFIKIVLDYGMLRLREKELWL